MHTWFLVNKRKELLWHILYFKHSMPLQVINITHPTKFHNIHKNTSSSLQSQQKPCVNACQNEGRPEFHLAVALLQYLLSLSMIKKKNNIVCFGGLHILHHLTMSRAIWCSKTPALGAYVSSSWLICTSLTRSITALTVILVLFCK